MTEDEPRAAGEPIRIPIVEEQLTVSTEQVDTGRISVHSRVISETRPVHETLDSRRIRIERVAADHLVEEMPRPRSENGRTIIPVTEEVLVKRYRIVEEIHLIEEHSTETVNEDVTLRRVVVDVTRE